MTRMDCGEVRDLLASFADDELNAEERLAVAQHLEACRDCGAALGDLEALRQRLKAAGTFALPAGLEQRVRRAIGLEEQRQAPPWWGRAGRIAATHVAALVLGAALAYGIVARGDMEHAITREIVAAHVRSLMADQLVQVATADTHTVKPWFTGRIAFAPDVLDLAARDFPLLGGRVDFVLDHPAAAIVYGRRKHRINLFVLPEHYAPAVPAFQTMRNGYNVLAWRQGGFAYFAASDLNPAELGEFAAALRGR